ALDFGEIAEEPTGEIDEMHALVDELAATGERFIRAPFFFIAEAPAVSVARADEHKRPDGAGVDKLARFLQREMVAVVKAHADEALMLCGSDDDGIQFFRLARRGFFNEDVLTCFDSGPSDLGQ